MTKKKDICSNYFLPTSDKNQRALCNSDRKQTYLDSLSTNLNIFVCIIAAAKSEYYERHLYYDKAHIYFITIYNEHEEKLVYIGKTDSKKSRFSNGHLAALKLHNPIYNGYNKRVYFGTVMFLSDDKEYVPLEFISPYSRAERYLSEMEAYLIERLNPELNKKKEPLHLLENLSSVLIQNFSEENAFMKDFFV